MPWSSSEGSWRTARINREGAITRARAFGLTWLYLWLWEPLIPVQIRGGPLFPCLARILLNNDGCLLIFHMPRDLFTCSPAILYFHVPDSETWGGFDDAHRVRTAPRLRQKHSTDCGNGLRGASARMHPYRRCTIESEDAAVKPTGRVRPEAAGMSEASNRSLWHDAIAMSQNLMQSSPRSM